MEELKKFVETNFKKFDPQIHGSDRLPDVPGNYIVVLRKGSHLPDIGIVPIMKTLTFETVEYEVIYTGISRDSLRSRDYKKHFTGNNAGVSTLRKSLGSLMGMTKTARDKSNPGNGKTKFIESDEVRLSQWMRDNLLLFFRGATVSEVEGLESELIGLLNPPLNLRDNHSPINSDFRDKLSELRK